MNIEALQTGLEYARLALAEHDERYQRHPTMESDRKIITDDIRVIENAIQQAEAQQPATAIACGIPGMAKTTCPYCEQGFAFEYEQPATPEPVGEPRARVELMKTGGNAGLSTRIIELDIATLERLLPGDLLYTHPAPGVPDWAACQRIAEVPEVDEVLRLFAEGETTEDQAVAIVQAVLTAAQAKKEAP